MSVIVFCVFLCISGCFRGSSAGLEITAEPGENVTLTCRTEKKNSLIILEWSREGLGTKKVFVLRDGRPFPARQHESYENRVFLKDSQMKDGDLSVVLKNVTMNDTGTYQCRVRYENDPETEPKKICTVHLSVVPPGDPSPGDPSPGDPSPGDPSPGDPSPGHEDGGSRGLLGLIALPVLAVVLVLLFWIYKKKSRCFSGESSDKKMDDL